jgi:hypothetical protein
MGMIEFRFVPLVIYVGQIEESFGYVDMGCFTPTFPFSLVDGGGVLDAVDGIEQIPVQLNVYVYIKTIYAVLQQLASPHVLTYNQALDLELNRTDVV